VVLRRYSAAVAAGGFERRRSLVEGLAIILGVLAVPLGALAPDRLGFQLPAKPEVEISFSPAEPTTKDQITFTVKAEETSRFGLKRIILLLNDKEVKSCLTSPCVYFGGPFPEGPLKFGARVYDYTADDPAAVFKMINIRTPAGPSRKPARAIDLLALAEDARTRWTDGYINIPFPGEEDDLRAFACYRYDADLEDDGHASRVLLTHPRSTDTGAFILGIFKIRDLAPGATFRARVGFLRQADETDSAEFRVFAGADKSYFAAKLCFHDGRLDDLVLDLDRYAGEDVELVLQVRALDGMTRHLAAWVDPRVEW
jgi:hypothetical protein